MSEHPYQGLPPEAFWRLAVVDTSASDVDPVIALPFTITAADRIATGGSCFAQHIARHLHANGFNFLITETAHPIASESIALTHNYGVYTARYGNIYTSRQLVQLFKRAYGVFRPLDDMWHRKDGRLVDPFRPQINPDGYLTAEEYRADRKRHFACVRQAFEECSVFVFTLGLTECWASRLDGSVYPLCPGVAGGAFDASQHHLVNLNAAAVEADMVEFIDLLRGVNRKARVILTVSPVPLIATATGNHVLVSTTYSKSVLRVACEGIASARPEVAYFPSYEIITGSYTRGRYFESDLRSVTESGVGHVMRLFLKHFANRPLTADAQLTSQCNNIADDHSKKMEDLVRVICDEEAIDQTATAL